MNLICKSGNLEIWKFKSGNLESLSKTIWKSANLETWEFEFVLYVAVKVWTSGFPDFQTFLD